MEIEATKKKPGRPKKKIIAIQVDTHGVVPQPCNPDDILELVYCNPSMFKKLLQLYKAFSISEININFDVAGVRINNKDHLGKSTIYTTIDGKCTNLYYCKEPIRVCVKRANLERIFNALNKNQYKVSFVLRENYRSTMYILTHDLEYSMFETYDVDVVFNPEQPAAAGVAAPIPRDNDAAYPVKFKVSAKHFKSKISAINKLSKTFTIQKYGAEPLQLTFDKAQTVNWTAVYNDGEKIGLQSTLQPDEMLSATVYIDHIYPFSNSVIGDDVYIAADKMEKMSFTTYLDKKDIGWTTCIKIFTEIKDCRPPAAQRPADG